MSFSAAIPGSLLFSLLLIISMINSCIELEISAPGFPDMQSYFHVSESMIELSITLNLIGFFFASFILGPLSDAYGRRRIMIIGNGILSLGSFACVLAPSLYWLLSARFIQGLGAATSAVVVSAIIADVYKADHAAKLYGRMNAVFTSLMALAPVLGGIITSAVGWRGNYAVVAMICIVSWLLLCAKLPETSPERKSISLSVLRSEYGTLLSHSPFLIAATVPSLTYACYLMFVALAPFMYMSHYGLGLMAYTLHQGAIVAAIALSSAVCGNIAAYFGNQRSILFALGCIGGGSAALILSITPLALSLSMSLFCVGSALLYPIIFAHSLDIFPQMKGSASSLIMGLRYVVCSLLLGIAGFLYHGEPVVLGVLIFCVSGVICVLTRLILPKLKLGVA